MLQTPTLSSCVQTTYRLLGETFCTKRGQSALGYSVPWGAFGGGDNLHYYTSIRQYFSPTTPFPSRKDTGIGLLATCEANGSVKCVLEKQARQQSAKKWKLYTYFSDTDRAKISQYAAIIVTMRLLVKMEGGAKIGTAHSQI